MKIKICIFLCFLLYSTNAFAEIKAVPKLGYCTYHNFEGRIYRFPKPQYDYFEPKLVHEDKYSSSICLSNEAHDHECPIDPLYGSAIESNDYYATGMETCNVVKSCCYGTMYLK